MPNPTPGDVHVNRPLTNISTRYMNRASNFIASRAFPLVSSDKQSNIFFTYPKGIWFKSEARPRAPGTETPGIGYDVEQDTFYCVVKGVHKDIEDQTRANQDQPLNEDQAASELVTQNMLIRREKDFHDAYFTTGIWATDVAGSALTAYWDDYSTPSTPILDIQTQIDAIEAATGFTPNKLTLAKDVWSALKNNPDFIDRMSNDSVKIVQPQLLANILELDEVLIARTVENTALEGATASMSHIFSDGALLTYSPPNPSINWPSAGYIFSWTGYLGASPAGTRIKRYRMEQYASDRVEGEIANDHKLVAADLGCFFNGVLTP